MATSSGSSWITVVPQAWCRDQGGLPIWGSRDLERGSRPVELPMALDLGCFEPCAVHCDSGMVIAAAGYTGPASTIYFTMWLQLHRC